MCVLLGAWETKVSNREKKKQQRRKDKGPEDSGSSGWVEAQRTTQEAPAGPVSASSTKRNRNRGIHFPSVQLVDCKIARQTRLEHFAVLLSGKNSQIK